MGELLKRWDNFEDVDICFDKNPLKPFLLANARIDSKLLKYKRYNTSKSLLEIISTKKKKNRNAKSMNVKSLLVLQVFLILFFGSALYNTN